MKTNMSVNDVRAICKALIEMDGDVTKVSEKCGFPATLILRIKNKEYMKAISDSYFDNARFNKPATGVREPERVIVTEVTTPEPEPTPTPVVETPEVTPKEIPSEPVEAPVETPTADVEEGAAQQILKDFPADDVILTDGQCHIATGKLKKTIEKLCIGTPVSHTVKDVGISYRTAKAIRAGKKFVEYTRKYFTVIDDNTIVNNETGVKYISHHGGSFSTTAENPDGTISRIFPKPIGDITKRKKPASKKAKKVEQSQEVVKAEPINLDVSPSVIEDITDLTVKLLLNKKITDLPTEIIEKITPILSEYTDNLTLREIKELMG